MRYHKDRLESNDIKVEHCNTDEMVADFFTKPFPGKSDYGTCIFLIHIKNIQSIIASESTTFKERVGENLGFK